MKDNESILSFGADGSVLVHKITGEKVADFSENFKLPATSEGHKEENIEGIIPKKDDSTVLKIMPSNKKIMMLATGLPGLSCQNPVLFHPKTGDLIYPDIMFLPNQWNMLHYTAIYHPEKIKDFKDFKVRTMVDIYGKNSNALFTCS